MKPNSAWHFLCLDAAASLGWRRPVAHKRIDLHQQGVKPAFGQKHVPQHPIAFRELSLEHSGLELPNVHELGGERVSARSTPFEEVPS